MIKIQILAVLLLIVLDDSAALDVTVERMDCKPNEEICFDNICNLKTNSKGRQVFDLGCNFKEAAQENMVATIILYRKETDGYKQFLVNITEEICSSSKTILGGRLAASIKCGNFLDTCPAKGNRTLIDCPMDMSLFPGIIPNGNYRTNSFLRNTHTNKEILSIETYFTLGPKS